MKKETKIVIGKILNLVEGSEPFEFYLEELDLLSSEYDKIRQDFNKTKVTR